MYYYLRELLERRTSMEKSNRRRRCSGSIADAAQLVFSIYGDVRVRSVMLLMALLLLPKTIQRSSSYST